MLVKVKEKITKINKAAGVEMILLPEGRCRIFLTILILNKGSIIVEKKEWIEEGNIEKLKDILEKDIPVFLILNGRGILHKKIAESGSDSNYLVQSVLPNAKAQDFYIQNILSEKTCLVSIIRKESVDPILEAIEKSGLHCIGISLGGVVASVVLPLISDVDNKQLFAWAENSLEFDSSGNITDYKFLSASIDRKSFKIDTEKIEDQYLNSYAAAFSLLTNNAPTSSFVEKVVLNNEEFLNKQLFKKMSLVALCFFFVVLMLNFVLFAKFSSKNNELSLKENKYSSLFAEMENLGKQVNEKESFLSGAGWLQPSSMTYYGDGIAATVPTSVRLTEFSINPIDERKSKEEKKELFTPGIIIIKGDCAKPTELNEWLSKIKAVDKITKARLVHYAYDDKDNKGSFSIEIETEN